MIVSHRDVPEGSRESDHANADVTFGRTMTAPSVREWYLTVRLGRFRHLFAVVQHDGRWYFRRNRWHIGPDHGANLVATDGRS